MKEIFKLKTFWLVVILATGVFLAALLNFNRGYKSETSILVIPKNNVSAENSAQILENLKLISFGVNSETKAERVKNSGILKIVSFNTDRFRVESLNKQAVENFIATASQFYNIKTDLDIRIISGPITKQSSAVSVYILSIESLLGAFILASLAFIISFSTFRKKKIVKKNYFQTAVKENKTLSEPSSKIKEKSYRTINKKAAAPKNLPVREATQEEVKERLNQLQNNKPIIKEATPEEVKERLNQLLNGKF